MHVQLVLFYLTWGIEFLLLIPFIFRFKELDQGGRWAFYYLLVSLLLASGSFFIAIFWRNNMWFLNIMAFVQFAVLSGFFQVVIKNTITKRLIAIIILPVFFLFLADLFKLEGLYAHNSYFTTLRTFVLILYGVLYFWQLLRDDELVKKSIFINSLPAFWYNAGFFIYHCGSFMFCMAYNLNAASKSAELHEVNRVLLSVTYVAGIIQLILFYIGLQKAKKTQA